METIRPLPCPLCGADASAAESEGGYWGTRAWAICTRCGCRGPVIEYAPSARTTGEIENEAVFAWNARSRPHDLTFFVDDPIAGDYLLIEPDGKTTTVSFDMGRWCVEDHESVVHATQAMF